MDDTWLLTVPWVLLLPSEGVATTSPRRAHVFHHFTLLTKHFIIPNFRPTVFIPCCIISVPCLLVLCCTNWICWSGSILSNFEYNTHSKRKEKHLLWLILVSGENWLWRIWKIPNMLNLEVCNSRYDLFKREKMKVKISRSKFQCIYLN